MTMAAVRIMFWSCIVKGLGRVTGAIVSCGFYSRDRELFKLQLAAQVSSEEVND